MRMYVKVIAGVGVEDVRMISDGEFIVRTTVQPERGKANALTAFY